MTTVRIVQENQEKAEIDRKRDAVIDVGDTHLDLPQEADTSADAIAVAVDHEITIIDDAERIAKAHHRGRGIIMQGENRHLMCIKGAQN